MDRYSFATFVVDDLNREAYEKCREIARAGNGASPVLLLGETGSGKTHLLYAIANRQRAVSANTALVYMAPGRVPNAARALVSDPAPIDMAEHAILLVDDLEGFEHDAELLEAIVQIFAQNDHAIVFAASVNPGRLAWLPGNTREAAQKAVTTPMERRIGTVEAESAAKREREALEAVVAEQARNLDELRARDKAPLAETHKEEIEHLRAENELLKISSREVESLRDKLRRLEAGGEAASTLKSPAPEDAHTHAEARAMLEQAETLLARIDQSRQDFAAAQRDQEQQLSEIERLESVFSKTPPEGQAALESDREAELAELRAEMQRIQDDADERIQAVLESIEPILGPIPYTSSGEDGEDPFERLRQAVVRLDGERTDRQERIGELEQELEMRQKQVDETTALIEDFQAQTEMAAQEKATLETALEEAREAYVRVEAEWTTDRSRNERAHEDLLARIAVSEDQARKDSERIHVLRQNAAVLSEGLARRCERIEEERRDLYRMLDLIHGGAEGDSSPSPESVAQLAEAGALIRAYEKRPKSEASGDAAPDTDVAEGAAEPAVKSEEPISKEEQPTQQVDAETDETPETSAHEVDEMDETSGSPIKPDRSIYRPDFGAGFRPAAAAREEDDTGDEYTSRNQTA